MEKQKLTRKQLLLVTSLIFGMFFGAGNLIFPVQLGQLAGHNWLLAVLGFLLTGALMPFLAMLAVSMTNSKSVYDLAAPVAPWFGTVVLVAIHFTIGPLSGTPRTAATAFAMGVSPFVAPQYQQGMMLIFSAIFFGLAYVLTVKQAGLTKWVGKYLNPLFLIVLGVVLVLALILPMGNFNQTVSATYQQNAGFQGVLDGYNTMDGLALLALAVSVVYAVRGMGFHGQAVSKVLAKAGFLSIVLESLLYVALVLLGVSSLGQFKPAENGGAAFSQIVTHYMGNFGVLITGVIVTLAVFTTAMGLFVSFAQDLNRVFPKVSYLWWLRVIAFGSFVTANAGLTNIVKWTVPVLMLLYPYALALIALSLLSPWIKQSPTIYRAVMGFVTLPAFLDAFASSPVAGWAPMADLVASYHQHLPLAADGFGWVLPALLGGLVGLTWQRAQQVQLLKDVDGIADQVLD
ncbi:branched-chain amino acid transport system II carrier protein [Convivina intestini]|uniref:Branched-chain amino acid transport system carrier protein n=1 Tax=Convivina intestini TaxID=1505726 RepID=A0A2U1DF94_9LACO|nr:branched-chain amino acid transport system II carrier protein [Convivina intestini]PVY86222.1 LIVCS family branched-chain amino acid:cation transporter [Convivina intestini]CAH1851334.1 Branched-chain amino acid transport system 2 carrier protein [Convivina intestini]SDB81618.1 branched-chain amino acid:cation transporter, LIVCS family [Leuconostocaceae bacterium R-53105]